MSCVAAGLTAVDVSITVTTATLTHVSSNWCLHRSCFSIDKYHSATVRIL